jgi:hypothetical protein
MLITVSLPKIKILQRFDLCARDCDFLPLRLNLPAQRRDVSIPRDGLPLLAAGAMEQTRLLVNDPGTVAVAGDDPVWSRSQRSWRFCSNISSYFATLVPSTPALVCRFCRRMPDEEQPRRGAPAR